MQSQKKSCSLRDAVSCIALQLTSDCLQSYWPLIWGQVTGIRRRQVGDMSVISVWSTFIQTVSTEAQARMKWQRNGEILVSSWKCGHSTIDLPLDRKVPTSRFRFLRLAFVHGADAARSRPPGSVVVAQDKSHQHDIHPEHIRKCQ